MANPVGTARKLQAVEDYVAAKTKEWKEDIAKQSDRWWKFREKNDLTYAAVRFVIRATDDLVLLVEEQIPSGADKKATVLAALGLVFDAVAAVSLPIWLEPFEPEIRTVLIDIVLSETIDFLVEKYDEGSFSRGHAGPSRSPAGAS